MEQVRLFFSHSSKDDAFGRRLVADLRTHLGDDAVWYDAAGGLHGGEEWWDRIVAEVTARNTFVVLLSADALSSAWVRKEMSIAYSQHVRLGKRLVPLMYSKCEPPVDWQLIQNLRFTDDLSYDDRLATLLRDLGYSGPITTVSLTAQPALANLATNTASLDIAKAPPTPKEQLVARLVQEVHTAFGRENWRQVLLRARTLQDEAHEAMTPLLWRELGLAAMELDDYSMALTALDHALAEDPYDASALRSKAQVLSLQDHLEEARKLLERALSYIPLDETEPQVEILNEIIGILDEENKTEEVLATYNQLLTLDPTNAGAWNGKAETLYELERHLAALSAVNRALDLDKTNVFIWSNKGNILSALEHDEEALEAYEEALSLDSKWAFIWIRKGDALFNLERYEEALEAYEQAVSLDPTSADAWNDKGDALFNLERYEEALEAYDRSLTIDDTNADYWEHRADVMRALKNFTEAKESERRAIELRAQALNAPPAST